LAAHHGPDAKAADSQQARGLEKRKQKFVSDYMYEKRMTSGRIMRYLKGEKRDVDARK